MLSCPISSGGRVASFGTTVPDTARFLPRPLPLPGETVDPEAESDRFVTDFADLALRVRSRMELGGDWSRFEPCDLQFKASCNATLIPRLSPEFLFGVQLDGTIADRIRVDVDFDQAREFDAANRINIFYEGAEDDILRRLEVGDVTFRLPRSRFLTEGIPAGNFGFQAEGQLGPVDFQTVWAQQRGDLNSRVFQLSGIGDQRGFVQEDTLVLDDADYAGGQFFFLVDPSVLERFPHVDVLSLDPASAPASVAPGDSPIQLYRFEEDAVLRQQVQGFIQADAVAGSAPDSVVESGWFRYLQPGLDYFVHPSGLWVALRTPLRSEEMLAVTYVTALGDTVGDYDPERIYNSGGRPTLRLLKASGANHQPGRPTWDLEMHQVYRVSGSPDVEEGSVDLTVSLGERARGGRSSVVPPARASHSSGSSVWTRKLRSTASTPRSCIGRGAISSRTRIRSRGRSSSSRRFGRSRIRRPSRRSGFPPRRPPPSWPTTRTRRSTRRRTPSNGRTRGASVSRSPTASERRG